MSRFQQRLAADRKYSEAQKAGHVLRQARALAWLEQVVEEQEIHSEKPDDQGDIQGSSHGSTVDGLIQNLGSASVPQ